MPTGLDIQKRFDDLKADLSAKAMEQGVTLTVQIPVRDPNNGISIFELSADSAGVVTDGGDLFEQVNGWKTAQDAFNTARAAYDNSNVSENIGALNDAKGEYIV